MVLSNIYIICVTLKKAREKKSFPPTPCANGWVVTDWGEDTNFLFLMAYTWLRYYNTKREHAGDNLSSSLTGKLVRMCVRIT